MVKLLDTDGNGQIGYAEFRRFCVLLPGALACAALWSGLGCVLCAASKYLHRFLVCRSGCSACCLLVCWASFTPGLPACLPSLPAISSSTTQPRPHPHAPAGAQVSHTNILSAWVDSACWLDSMEYRLGHVPPSQPMVGFIQCGSSWGWGWGGRAAAAT